MKLSPAVSGTRLARWAAGFFTASDILCLCLQGGGGAMLSSTDLDTMEMGRKLLLVGLFLQLFFFGAFTVLTARLYAAPHYGFRHAKAWRPLFATLFITIALLTIRNIFRVVEFVQGFDGYLASHEVYFYVFDCIPILLCTLLFTQYFYGLYLPPYVSLELDLAGAGAANAAEDGCAKLAGSAGGGAGGLLEVMCVSPGAVSPAPPTGP
jgi:hypothetical protein